MDHAAEFAATPIHQLLGLHLVARSPQRAEVELPVHAGLLQEALVVQGGVLTALADTAAVQLLWPDLPPDRTMTGTGCSMQFLGPGRLGEGPLRAVALVLQRGSTLAVCEAVVTQGERLVAKGTFTFLFRDRRP